MPDVRPGSVEARLVAMRPSTDPVESRRVRARVLESLTGEVSDPVRLGRYVVLGRLGEGSTGVVYQAYDPQLDRKVALKLLQPAIRGDGHERARLVREAKAMARLSHPNVVDIFDVVEIGDGMVLTMELVDGQTLEQWLRAGEGATASAVTIIDAFIHAGDGLAMAHDVGLVHRDFKPANVLVGRDGRICVTDFGLARPLAVDDEHGRGERSTLAASPPSSVSTRSDGIAGTPAYMAPEVLAGATADARADQYSFCVALHEALYRERPEPGAPVGEHGGERGRRSGERVPPKGVVRVLERGLDPDPSARFGSMEALLRALRRAAAGRRRGVVGALATIGLGGVLLAGMQLQGDPVCTDAGASIDGVWGLRQRSRVRERFAATRIPYAPDTAARVERQLDRHARAWADSRTEACQQALRPESSAHRLDRRVACLDRNLRELDALVRLLLEADTEVVEHALEMAASLGAPERCADPSHLEAGVALPDDPDTKAEVAATREVLGRAELLTVAGKYAEALQLAEEAATDARRVNDAPLVAEALFQLGHLQDITGAHATAERTLSRSFFRASAVRHDEISVRSAVQLVELVGVDLARADDGMMWGRHAEAALDRIDVGNERGQLYQNLGVLARHGGDYWRSLAYLDEAAAAFARVTPSDPTLARLSVERGRTLMKQGRFDEAHEQHQRALALWEASLGAGHPETGRALLSLGSVSYAEPALDDALAYYERARQVFESALGPDSRAVADALSGIALVHGRRGEPERARRVQAQALVILRRVHGRDHPAVARAQTNLAFYLTEMGALDDARRELVEAIESLSGAMGRSHVELAHMHIGLGDLLARMGEHTEAEEHYRRVLELRTAVLGPDHVALAYTLHSLGISVGERDVRAAVPVLERAATIAEAAEFDPLERPKIWTDLALMLRRARQQPQRVAQLLQRARADYLARGDDAGVVRVDEALNEMPKARGI